MSDNTWLRVVELHAMLARRGSADQDIREVLNTLVDELVPRSVKPRRGRAPGSGWYRSRGNLLMLIGRAAKALSDADRAVTAESVARNLVISRKTLERAMRAEAIDWCDVKAAALGRELLSH